MILAILGIVGLAICVTAFVACISEIIDNRRKF
jgi:hypothetical protein